MDTSFSLSSSQARRAVNPLKHALALALCVSAVHAHAVSNYVFKDLAALGGGTSQATALNDLGQIVGFSAGSDGISTRATLWSADLIVDLGTLGGTNSYAYGINNLGQVVGQAATSGDSGAVATMWASGTATALGTLGGSYSSATGINDKGQIVGWSLADGNPSLRGVKWHAGSMEDLNWEGAMGESYAEKINNAGSTVGASWFYDKQGKHATVWQDGVPASDLGTLEAGTYSFAHDINDKGVVVGMSGLWGDRWRHATVWNGTEEVDLGTLGGSDSYASAINNHGEIVGASQLDEETSAWRATLWRDGVAIDLNSYLAADSEWILQTATDINDKGWIIGKAFNKTTGLSQGYVLMAPVPEPETYGLFFAGLGVMALVRARRSRVLARA